MGVFDNLGSIFSGSGKTTQPVAFEDGETEIARVVACTVKGGGHPWVGGDLVLTDRKLIFTPLDTQDLADLLAYGLKRVNAPGGAAAVGWIQNQIVPIATSLDSIIGASAHRSAGWLNPPTADVQRSDQTLEFGILASRTTPSRSKRNERLRDEFVRTVQQRL